MSSINYVSRETYDAILAKQDEARALRKQLKNPLLSLADKIDLQRRAKALEQQASELANS